MAASSRAQVLDLYRAMLRESKRFGAYNYRSTLARCIRPTSLSLRIKRSPGPRSRDQPPTAAWTTGSICSVCRGAPSRPQGAPASALNILTLPALQELMN
ncbi:LYR motif-containing protein 4 isoform X5 [Dama dama]|uniref:LYR motif-containing protein 4 isoform X5 n=1 Tax=Dama dama TaxID=30532 RepID=UPI002A362EA8|nr:LYR motif-containing protein 4 isoform X5 [Dama dama]